MVPWGALNHLYKGLATIVIALIALQYLFGSVLENRRTTDTAESLIAQYNRYRNHNISKPRFYQGAPISIEKTNNNSILISTILNYNKSQATNNNSSNLTQFNENPSAIPNCPIVSPDLEGPIQVNKTISKINELEAQFGSWLQPGGAYAPTNCVSQSVVAVIVPYRDRAENLLLFLAHMHPFLKKQQLDYAIYIIEQDGTGPFNRAMLMNVGFTEALKHRQYQCFIFHDVDLLPEDDRNLYNCPEQPRHMSVAVDIFKYRLPYQTLFGGVCALTRDQFISVNGFSNMFWGWGGEDDDMSNRVIYHNYHISRYPVNIARYTMLTHHKQKANPKRYETLVEGKKRYSQDGLNSLKYTLKQTKFNLLYTWVLVELHAPS
ncbi:beta-1,4-N-acetylgalactosaminyltransferase bre-4 [Chrysoperla carnea]|uniref:beta-1,4-N-acetylgalactosaminyltransferase bre-4 n=1 Tax=Chrysoperla carnea TaxID=189513 RepID=UPI001D08ABB3|nr:beta-1,4-N-acetylgalactosaminyltransferase bre-4 [Chrysoperla carnea]